jgi:hypothetical protein
MKAGVYFPLFLVARGPRRVAIYSLPTEFQLPKLFKERKPLSGKARRAGWQGFMYDLRGLDAGMPILLEVLTLAGRPVSRAEEQEFRARRV